MLKSCGQYTDSAGFDEQKYYHVVDYLQTSRGNIVGTMNDLPT